MRKGVHGPLAKSGNSPPLILDYQPPTDEGLEIVYEDRDVLVLSKPAGLLSVPGNKPDLLDCMESRVKHRYPEATTVHRLDRGTSGIFLMTRNHSAHRHIGLQFEKRKTSKTYIAVVGGIVADDTGVIDFPLRTDWYNRPKQMVDVCLGREAITHWRVIKRCENSTRLELKPVTGRSHQLRVHMQNLGHPILGDEFYAPDDVQKMSDRLMLHAEILEISHPKTGAWMTFCDPCPF